MDTLTQAPVWAHQTPGGWLAGSEVFPRIAVFGATEREALAELESRRQWWLSLPIPEGDREDGQ